jgi:hypothetical protein
MTINAMRLMHLQMHMNTEQQEKAICTVMLVKNKKRKNSGKSTEIFE